MTRADLLIAGAAQVLTCASPRGPRRGSAMQDVGLVAGDAIAIADGRIADVGPAADLRQRYIFTRELDAAGGAVCPGFVDPHTHAVYAGDRVEEFERRVRGETYQQIMAGGGGIQATVRATRNASLETIVRESRQRLDRMLRLGTTTVEVKTGYGLDLESELKLLRAIELLGESHPADLVATFMPAHAVPPGFAGGADGYVDHIVDRMLPAAVQWHRAAGRVARQPMFVDVFCEQNAFSVAQSRRVLEAARALGLPVKAHVDEFSRLGGLEMALQLGAVSVDHLDETGADGIAALARSDAIAVVIPAVNFNLGATRFANARAMIDAGAAVALTTDINPGSSPCPSMPLVMAIACRYQRLSPAEALNAATVNAAHAIGLGARTGSIEAGKQADLLVLRAPDYRHLAYEFGDNPVRHVIKNGNLVV